MNESIFKAMEHSYTAYHAADNAAEMLCGAGFTELFECNGLKFEKGGKYFIRRGGSALIAIKIGDLSDYCYKIVASHLDSPALKLKYSPIMKTENMSRLNVETYGGGIWSSFLDVPLKIAGKIYLEKEGVIEAETYTDRHTYVIPNVAIHMNRTLNDGYKYNPQTDLAPIFGIDADGQYFEKLGGDKKVVGYDLFALNATKPFFAGANDEFLCSPRIDNQICAFASVEAIINSDVKGVAIAYLADNEEVGSHTAEGAGSDFLKGVLKAVNKSLGFDREQFNKAVARSFMVSADNAHGLHPNHPELSDPTNRSKMGGGVVIKHHANKNYTTDGLSSALFEKIANDAGAKTQHFFMRSDLRCGSTLGVISMGQIAVKSVDVGLAQLAMHSSLETMCAADIDDLVKALSAVYSASFTVTEKGYIVK